MISGHYFRYQNNAGAEAKMCSKSSFLQYLHGSLFQNPVGNDAGVHTTDNDHINCILLADDIVLLSETKEGRNKLLNQLKLYSDENQLKVKAMGGGGSMIYLVKISVSTSIIELNEMKLFTELKKPASVLRYVVSNIAKIGVFHALAGFHMPFVANH